MNTKTNTKTNTARATRERRCDADGCGQWVPVWNLRWGNFSTHPDIAYGRFCSPECAVSAQADVDYGNAADPA